MRLGLVTYYARINDAKAFRKKLLEAARDNLMLISRDKEFEDIRQRKRLLVSELNDVFKDLGKLVGRLDVLMPEKAIKEELRQELKKAADALAFRMKQQQERKARETAEAALKVKRAEEERQRAADELAARLRARELQRKSVVASVESARTRSRQEESVAARDLDEIAHAAARRARLSDMRKGARNKPVAENKAQMTDVDRLEYTLSKIESKLAELDN